MEMIQVWVGAFLTLCVFSFLYRDNPFFKLAEHIFAGLTAGYYLGLYYDTVVYQQLIVGITQQGKWWWLFPGMIGILMFSRLSPKYSWLSRYGLAFTFGSTSGVFLLSELHGNVLGQLYGTVAPQTTGGEVNLLLTGIVILGLVTTLLYFYFSHEHKGALGWSAKIGILFIMISFGAHFGYTVMGRISLLIGRVYFLWYDWILGSLG